MKGKPKRICLAHVHIMWECLIMPSKRVYKNTATSHLKRRIDGDECGCACERCMSRRRMQIRPSHGDIQRMHKAVTSNRNIANKKEEFLRVTQPQKHIANSNLRTQVAIYASLASSAPSSNGPSMFNVSSTLASPASFLMLHV